MLKDLIRHLQPHEGDTSRQVSRKQKTLFWLLAGGAAVVFLLMMTGLEKAAEAPQKTEKPKQVVLGDLVKQQDVWSARMEGEAAKIRSIAETLKSQNELQEKRLKTLEEALTAKMTPQGARPSPMPAKPKETASSPHVLKSDGFSATSATGGDGAFGDMPEEAPPFKEPSSRSLWHEGAPGDASGKPPLLREKKILHLSSNGGAALHHAKSFVVAGSYAKAVLTSGVVVSTATSTQGNPQPILMRLADGGTMPRGWKSHLKDAVIIGSCYGDLSSERALCRMHKLSLVEKDGRTVEREVEGWIVGEDGAPGLRGKVVDKAGAVAREAFLTGILSGMSNFLKFEAQSSVYPVTPFGQTHALKPQDALKGGMGQGASSALDKLAEFSIKRAESMQPVIVVNPGRVVDVVFKTGFDLKDLGQETTLKRVQASTPNKSTSELNA